MDLAILPETLALFHGDMPATVKAHILLALRGGRLPPERCLKCRTHCTGVGLWIPKALLSPVPGSGRPRLYRLCDACYEAMPDHDEIGVLHGEP